MPVITNAGEYLITQQQQAGEPLIIDQMILANITGLDSNTVPSRDQSMPAPADVKIIKPITKDGLLNTNTVVYSTVFTSTDGTFDFNYMGLYSSAHDVIVAVAYVPLQTKIKTVGTDVGNVITKNFAIEFNAAADITGINISAESWQIDYTARLLSMDKHQRDLVKNIYGPSTFLNDAFKVKFETDKYYLTAGKAILGGINFDLEADLEIVPGALPQTVWLDVYQETSMMGVLNKHDVVINDGTVLTDYVAGSVEHTLVKLGVVNSSVDIVDGRSLVKRSLELTTKNNDPKNVAELRKYRPEYAGQKLDIDGHTLAGIGGGPFFHDPDDSTSPDNNGTVIVNEWGDRWKREVNGVISVEMFGATGVNDSVAVQAALNNMIDGVELVSGLDMISLDSELDMSVIPNHSKINLNSKLVFSSQNGIDFRSQNSEVRISKISHTGTGTGVGFNLRDSVGNDIFIGSVVGFYRDFQVFSTLGTGCFNNTVRLPDLECVGDNEAACLFATVEAGGFCNQNIIYPGFMRGPRGVYFKKGAGQTARFDGNKIIYPEFEQITYIGLEINYSNWSEIIYPRFEGTGTPSSWWMLEGSDCINTRYDMNWIINPSKLSLNGEKHFFNGPIIKEGGGSVIAWQTFGGILSGDTVRYTNTLSGGGLQNNTWYHGGVDGDLMWERYAGGVQDSQGRQRAFGLLNPIGYQQFSGDSGDQSVNEKISFIEVTASAGPIALVMPSEKEIDGITSIRMRVTGGVAADISVKNSSLNESIPAGSFADGVWEFVFRFGNWRAYQIANNWV